MTKTPAFALTADDLEAIRQTMADYDCDHWGLRIVSAVGFDADAAVAPSRVWVDGEPTSDLLAGTSAVAIDRQGRPVVDLRPYLLAAGPGAVVMLIGSDEMEHGEDDGEIVIVDGHTYWHKVLA